ncbi:hypothetical protein [Metabacillus idriensis]|uniref:hypothetical protein n=1 Tax=Metabacillus idriensis TaxID=324768 RepID=UPI0017495B9A|nr:hypothetical protein [Metabacillus idriensis]
MAAFLLCFSLLNPNRKTAQAGYISIRQEPEPFLMEKKTASQQVKGHKTFFKTRLQQKKLLCSNRP